MNSRPFFRLAAQVHPQRQLISTRHFSRVAPTSPSIKISFSSHPPHINLKPSSHISQPKRFFTTSKMSSEPNGVPSKQTVEKADAHQYQAGSTTDREEDQWKHREPYKVHEKREDFDVKWEGSCHCGKVTYQLSREKPLAAKYCHCTTCQRLHGVSTYLPLHEVQDVSMPIPL